MKPRSNPFLRSASLAASIVLTLGQAAHATTYYWDINGTTTTNAAATGTWQAASTTNWSTASAGNIATSAVTTNNEDNLYFAATGMTAATITVDTTQYAHSLNFNVAQAFTLSSGTAINLGSATAGSGVFLTANAAQTISTPVILNSAATALSFSNSGTSLLTIGAVTGAATTGTQALTVGSSNTGGITLGGIIGNGAAGGNVSLTVNSSGTGITTLSGASTFTGATNVSAGTLNLTGSLGNTAVTVSGTLSGEGSIGTAGSLTFNNGSFLRVNGSTAGALTVGSGSTGNLTLNPTTNVILDLVPAAMSAGTNTIRVLNYNGTLTGTAANLSLQNATNYRNATFSTATANQVNLSIDSKALTWSGASAAWDINTASNWNSGADKFYQGDAVTFTDAGTNKTITSTGIVMPTSVTFNNSTGNDYSVANVIAGATGLTKSNTGTVTLSGNNTYTGITTVSGGKLVLTGTSETAGTLDIASGATLELKNATAFGANSVTLTGTGTLQLNKTGDTSFGNTAHTISLGSGALINLLAGNFNGGASRNKAYTDNKADLYVASGAIFSTSNNILAIRVDALSGSGNIDSSSGSSSGAGFTFGVDNGTDTFDGSLTTTGTNKFVFTKAGTGTQTFTGSSSFASAMTVSNGTVTLNGANGAFTATTALTVGASTNAATMTLDNATNNNTARINAAATLSLSNGTFNYIGNTTTASTETLAGITASKGANLINLSGGASGQVAVLTSSAAAITRTAGAGLNIVADGTTQQFKLTGGSAGMLDKGIYLNGNDFAYYPGSGAAIVAPTYGGGDFAALTNSALTDSKHNKLNGSITSQAAASIYSLNMPSNYSITALTGNLTFTNAATQGGIIKSGGGAAQIGTATNAFDIVGVDSGELVFNTVAAADNLTLNVGITAASTALTKNGAGTLTLTTNRNNAYTGITTVNAGTLILTSKDSDSVKSTSIVINNGGTVKFGAADKVVNTALFTVNTGGTFDLNGNRDSIGALAGSGSVTNTGAAQTLTLTSGNSTFSGGIGGSLSLTINGARQTLTGTNTYTGVTTVSAGVLQFAKQVSLYNNNTVSWNSTNLKASSGATMAFNVGGTGEFTSGNIDTIKASTGIVSGAAIGLDTTNAGGSFTYNTAFASGVGLTKLGTGTLNYGCRQYRPGDH